MPKHCERSGVDSDACVRRVTRVKQGLTIKCRAIARLLRGVQEFLFNVEQHLFEFWLREHFEHLSSHETRTHRVI